MTQHTMNVLIGGVTVGVVVGLFVTTVFRTTTARLFNQIGRNTLLAAAVTAAISGLLYSVVHEFGHAIFATVLGGEVRSVTWTIFSGQEPHVSYNYLPDHARPWSSAGGYLFPTIIALLLVTTWLFFAHHLSRLWSLLLLIPSVIFLLCNFGSVFELFSKNSHMRRVANYVGVGRPGEVLLALALVSLSLGVYWGIWRRFKSPQAREKIQLPDSRLDTDVQTR